MNMMHHANISTMSPKVPLFQGRLSFIRPLCMVYEKETRVYASLVTTLPSQKPCPGMTGTTRKDTKVFLDQLEEIHPGTRLNFFRALASLRPPVSLE
jgi:tRNA(Ile)-lysidine synthase TilS/MesJ